MFVVVGGGKTWSGKISGQLGIRACFEIDSVKKGLCLGEKDAIR